MSKFLIKQACIVNEGKINIADVLIIDERIEGIATSIYTNNAKIIDAEGLYLIPGMIDDHVHFRQPGTTTEKAYAYNRGFAKIRAYGSYLQHL